MAGFSFGYDLGGTAKLNRDRTFIEGFDLRWYTGLVCAEAAARRPDLFGKLQRLLENGAQEVAGISPNSISCIANSSDLYDNAEASFRARYGENSFPVTSLEESKQLAHLGLNGIVVPKQLCDIVQVRLGSLADKLHSLSNEVVRQYGWNDLAAHQQRHLAVALNWTAGSAGVRLESVDVVDFRTDSTLGRYVVATDRIQIARKVLDDFDDTVATIIHEAAHRGGANDGSCEHVSKMEAFWTELLRNIRTRNSIELA